MATGNSQRHTLGRRSFLSLTGAGTAAVLLGTGALRPSEAGAAPRFSGNPFSLGVASGDPRHDGVVLWTRLAPDPLAADGTAGMPPENVDVRWEVAEDEHFRQVVQRGTVAATPQLGHSVHPEVFGLRPDREYFYRFAAGSEVSPVGRTRTAPAPGRMVDRLRFAFASCQNYPAGHYTAYQNMLREDLDLVVFLGDYIYEGAGPATSPLGRTHAPRREITTLADYRIRHALYKTDPHLSAAHAAFPWVVTWDDHEVENNWADEDSDPDTDPAAFLRRRAQAFQAYYENMPLRIGAKPVGPDLQLHRRVSFGRLADFHVLDTRQYRSDQVACNDADCDEAFDPDRTILGAEQERWLLAGLTRSTSRWDVLAQQVPVYEDAPVGAPNDKWDGYRESRRRLLDVVANRRNPNTIVVTGDVHFNSAADLKADFDDPGSRAIGSEFVGTSISSGGDGTPQTAFDPDPANPHLKFTNHGQRGYVRCEVTPDAWRTDYRVVDTVLSPTSGISTIASFAVEAGHPGMHRA